MNATKILWGQVLLVSFVVLAFVWGATEWVAWRLTFQPQLGRPWFKAFGWPLYEPPAFFWWWFAYDAYARDIFIEGAYIAASGGIAAVIVAQIPVAPFAEQDSIVAEQGGRANLRGLGPSGRAVSGDALHFPRPPD